MIVARFANRTALFTWFFTLCWVGMLLAFTWIFRRDGAPDGTPPEVMAAILAVFWLGGIGLLAYAMRSPMSSVTIDSRGEVASAWIYPHKRVRKVFAGASLGAPSVIEDRDSEDSPYFRARLPLPDGSFIDLVEAHDREFCERECERFAKVLSAQT